MITEALYSLNGTTVPEPHIPLNEAEDLFEIPPYDKWLGSHDMLDYCDKSKHSDQWRAAHLKAIRLRLQVAVEDRELRPLEGVDHQTLIFAEVALWALLTGPTYNLSRNGVSPGYEQSHAQAVYRLRLNAQAQEFLQRRCARQPVIHWNDLDGARSADYPLVTLRGKPVERPPAVFAGDAPPVAAADAGFATEQEAIDWVISRYYNDGGCTLGQENLVAKLRVHRITGKQITRDQARLIAKRAAEQFETSRAQT